jgi:hypothetical protein
LKNNSRVNSTIADYLNSLLGLKKWKEKL